MNAKSLSLHSTYYIQVHVRHWLNYKAYSREIGQQSSEQAKRFQEILAIPTSCPLPPSVYKISALDFIQNIMPEISNSYTLT